MLEKNTYITAVTEALGSNGEGIVRHEGITFFVPNSAASVMGMG